MSEQTITVESVDAGTWDELRTVFGERGDASGCWCQWFKLTGAQFQAASREEKADLLHASVEAGSPGVIARLDGEPVGWAAVEPFSAYPGLRRSPITKRQPGDPEDPWAVTCFVVRLEHRRQGVARALLAGAVEHAAARGAEVVEGYPVDPGVRPSLTAAERYHGTVSLFETAGFAVIRRPSATRAIMRLSLSS